jgi:hypothetical protein
MAHRTSKVQMEVGAVLALISLFTHIIFSGPRVFSRLHPNTRLFDTALFDRAIASKALRARS